MLVHLDRSVRMNTRLLVAVCTIGLASVTAGPVAAQGRGQAPGRPTNRRQAQPANRGQAKPTNRGQAKKAERGQVQARPAFREHDRELARNWYYHNRRELPPGLRRQDRLPPGLEARLRAGYVIGPDMRRRIYPVPAQLIRAFPPPPRGYRYVVFGGHVILVDVRFRVFDVIRLDLDLRP
jgi:Ni/Co efflux regulator RcnB